MRRIAAISAVILVVAVFACWLPAQDRGSPFDPIVTEKFGSAFDNPPRLAEPIDVEPRISALADDFSKTLIAALQEKVITIEQAQQTVKELEVVFAVKQARIDLLRVGARLDKVTAQGVAGSEELQQLRQQLKQLESVGQSPRVVTPDEPTRAPRIQRLDEPE